MIQRVRVPCTLRRMAEQVGLENGLSWTQHALERIWTRRIDPGHVIKVASNPDISISKLKDGRNYVQMWGQIHDGRTLYVCLDQEKEVVISVGWRTREEGEND